MVTPLSIMAKSIFQDFIRMMKETAKESASQLLTKDTTREISRMIQPTAKDQFIKPVTIS